MIHKDHIDHYDQSMEQLAKDLGDLKYDALSQFLKLLSNKIQEDGQKDQARGRVKLAKELFEAADKLTEAEKAINRAWIISEPYM